MKRAGHSPSVVVLLARCAKRKEPFGVRLERRDRAWFATWAFRTRAASAAREGYGATVAEGGLDLDASYPGCPWCEATTLVQCPCDKVSCAVPNAMTTTCGHCGKTARIEGYITRVTAGDDR